MTYQEFVMDKCQEAIDEYGGVRKAAAEIHIDASILSQMAAGHYVPKPKTLKKYFPNVEVDRTFIDDNTPVEIREVNETLNIQCDGFEQLKSNLSRLGYELIIQRKRGR